MTRALVIGGASLLGHYLVLEAVRSGREVISTYRESMPKVEGQRVKLDLTDARATLALLRSLRPEEVYLPAAMTNVDQCEREPSLAMRINAEGTRNVAQACAETKAKLLYVSTDYIFNGLSQTPYRETDKPEPISAYSRSKLEGERATLEASSDNLVCRVCVLYGWNRAANKSNFVTWIIDSLRSGKEIKLLKDQWVSPTYAPHAAGVMVDLMSQGREGVYHTTGPECLSRYEIGMQVAEVFDLDRSLIKIGRREEMRFDAKRPDRSCLDVDKVQKAIGRNMLTLREGLLDMRRTEGTT
ncbi:MAG: dTDP-4-dehydrorhamnose reductase [Methanomassiliicoccales archaeon]|nr:dTDP-4-dehydrorhamnose reductase [Methanomassiliicoccales archaeon]